MIVNPSQMARRQNPTTNFSCNPCNRNQLYKLHFDKHKSLMNPQKRLIIACDAPHLHGAAVLTKETLEKCVLFCF